MDFFSGYDQVWLDEESRDLTTFNSPLGPLRLTRLPQGATNSVAHFIRVIVRIRYDLIPDICRPFLNDVAVHGPITTYNNEESLPGVRRFVLEHLINLDRVLVNAELSGCSISGAKSEFCKASTVLLGYLCGTNRRSLEQAKIHKILEWTAC